MRVEFYTHLPAYEDGTECSETSAYKIQTPGSHPKESVQHSEQDESLKSRKRFICQNKHKCNGEWGQNYLNMNYIHFECRFCDLTLIKMEKFSIVG